MKRLDATDNKLSGSLDIVVKQCPELGALVLSNCKYTDVEALAPLKDSNIETLDMFSNAVTSSEEYREKVSVLILQITPITCPYHPYIHSVLSIPHHCCQSLANILSLFQVFQLIPSLKYLDGVNLDGEELDDSSDEDEVGMIFGCQPVFFNCQLVYLRRDFHDRI